MADSEKVSSLPSERERFEKAMHALGYNDFRLCCGGYSNSHTVGQWEGWHAASAGRQELLDALNEILFVHANDDKRPKAFYIASKALGGQ